MQKNLLKFNQRKDSVQATGSANFDAKPSVEIALGEVGKMLHFEDQGFVEASVELHLNVAKPAIQSVDITARVDAIRDEPFEATKLRLALSAARQFRRIEVAAKPTFSPDHHTSRAAAH